ncbi:hypothetical protein KKH23_07320 [Patescibacteria group bacterium]|nr:hypothetical protein [Patescibacteria group bacterium]
MTLFDSALRKINDGRKGLNVGLPLTFRRLAEYIPNIQKETYYLCGGFTKTGKTALVDDIFLYSVYDLVKRNPEYEKYDIDIDYFSFEIDKHTKIVKGIVRYLYYKYNIVTDINYVLSRGKNRISEDIYSKVVEAKEYFDKLEDILHIYDEPINPTGINKYLYRKAAHAGTVKTRNITIKDRETGNDKVISVFDQYIPNNPNRYHIVIIDHIGLMTTERGFTLKQNLDKMSQYFVTLRNNFGIIPVVVQQLSAETEDENRIHSKTLQPRLRDFSDSKYLSRDANVVMALFSPYPFRIPKWNNYDITIFGNYYRNLEVLANRDGEPNINIGLFFEGAIGTFFELPKANDEKELNKVYNYIKNRKKQ